MRNRRFFRGLALAAGLLVVLAIVGACTADDDPSGEGESAGSSAAAASAGAVASTGTGVSAAEMRSAMEAAVMAMGVAPQQVGSQNTGIWVKGTGTVSAEPDLARLTLGVQATRPTVAEARGDAAGAMTAIVAFLTSEGVAETDIRTQRFSLHPRYSYQDIVSDLGIRTNERVLTGYEVQNIVVITVRDLEAVGDLLDGAVDAGGDLARVDDVSFQIENTSALASDARQMAVQAALDKAGEMAGYAGVTLGQLVYLSEVSAPADYSPRFEAAAMALNASVSTPISGGELSVTVTVQAVFGLEQ